MRLQFKESLPHKLRAWLSIPLHWMWYPVFSQLTDDEYFQCRTRMDGLKILLKRRFS